MSNQKQQTNADIDLLINAADTFAQTGYNCNEYDKKIQNASLVFKTEAFYSIPTIVNLSFACELFLKALLLKSNIQCPHTHSLIDLYASLPKNKKVILQQEYAKRKTNLMTFEEVLEIHKKTFEEWRYIFEEKNNSSFSYPDNLLLAIRVIRDILDD